MADRPQAYPYASFVAGLLFAAGLTISGMTRPEKVLAFLTVGADWDPSLLLVMGAAVPVHALAWMLLRNQRAPLLGGEVPDMPAPVFNVRLLGGAGLFGVGWGIAGVCPGPAIVSLAAGGGALFFVPAMLAGIALSRVVAQTPATEERLLGVRP